MTRRARPKRRKRRKNPTGGPIPPIDFGRLFVGIMRDILGEPVVNAAIPPDMFRKLLSLCHPDKHGNSETATEVTRWLLEEREKQKNGGAVIIHEQTTHH